MIEVIELITAWPAWGKQLKTSILEFMKKKRLETNILEFMGQTTRDKHFRVYEKTTWD